MKNKSWTIASAFILLGALVLASPLALRLSRAVLAPEEHDVAIFPREVVVVDSRAMSPDEAISWLRGHRWSPRMHNLRVQPGILENVPEHLRAVFKQQTETWKLLQPHLRDDCVAIEWYTPPSIGNPFGD